MTVFVKTNLVVLTYPSPEKISISFEQLRVNYARVTAIRMGNTWRGFTVIVAVFAAEMPMISTAV